ncbi:MAG: hypothetical protein ACRD9S_20675 [Pyrinomonadaceae bacterium]
MKTIRVILGALILGIPLVINAGDCLTHPLIIHDLVIESCEQLTEENAAKISLGALPSIIVSRYPGVILSGQEKRTRVINIAEWSVKTPGPMPWVKELRPVTFLYRSNMPNMCSQFKKGFKTQLLYRTNCECDTGPSADGYCALTVSEVESVPAELKKYAQ